MPAKSGKKSGIKTEVRVGHGRFILSAKLGAGSFGDIYLGDDTQRQRKVAIKLEPTKVRHPQLFYEARVYKLLHGPPDACVLELHRANAIKMGREPEDGLAPEKDERGNALEAVGIARMHWFGVEGDFNVLVMELCGPSLEDLFGYCGRLFSLKTVLMIADQMIQRIQRIHSRGLLHRDIKPENFCFGTETRGQTLYILDFGLSKRYVESRTQKHIPFRDGKPLTGTARYCSANTHRGYEQSRRDDLESIGFLMVYMLRGVLPWQGIAAPDAQSKTTKIGEKKISTPLEEVCEGMPEPFLVYMQYCRALTFDEEPDYDHLRKLFRDLARCHGIEYDYMYDWITKRQRETATMTAQRQQKSAPDGGLNGSSAGPAGQGNGNGNGNGVAPQQRNSRGNMNNSNAVAVM